MAVSSLLSRFVSPPLPSATTTSVLFLARFRPFSSPPPFPRFPPPLHHRLCPLAFTPAALPVAPTLHAPPVIVGPLMLRRGHPASFCYSRQLNKSASESASGDSSHVTEELNGIKGQQECGKSPFEELISRMATTPALPRNLGVLGAVPFLALTPPIPYFLHFPEALSTMLIEAQAAYGAVILSFLGGPHWGLAMAGIHASNKHTIFNISTNSLQYVWSVIPSLLGWPSLLMPIVPKLGFLTLSFSLALVVDVFLNEKGLTPPWYLPLRFLLSAIAILCLTASMLEVLTLQKTESAKHQCKER